MTPQMRRLILIFMANRLNRSLILIIFYLFFLKNFTKSRKSFLYFWATSEGWRGGHKGGHKGGHLWHTCNSIQCINGWGNKWGPELGQCSLSSCLSARRACDQFSTQYNMQMNVRYNIYNTTPLLKDRHYSCGSAAKTTIKIMGQTCIRLITNSGLDSESNRHFFKFILILSERFDQNQNWKLILLIN